MGLPGFSVYSACKFGLRGFAEAMRRELGDCGVRVQYLGPRTTRTRFNDGAVEAYNHATGAASDSATAVGQALVRLLEGERAERYIGFPERLVVRVNALAPVVLDPVFAKHRRSLPAPLPCPDETLPPTPTVSHAASGLR
jgi:short-subunit dehydrogenase